MKKLFFCIAALIATMTVHANEVNLHFVNTYEWTVTPQVILYNTTTWEGTANVEMTLDEEKINGYDAYTYTFDQDTTSFDGFQFTDNTTAWLPSTAASIAENNGLYFYDGVFYTKEEIPDGPVVTKYYIVGEGAAILNDSTGTSWKTYVLLENNTIHIDAPANTTITFQIMTSDSWVGAHGYTEINSECSDPGYKDGGSNNITLTLTDDNGLTITMVEDKICLQGSFGEAVINTYTVVGSSIEVLGAEWLETDTNNDMTYVQDDDLWVLEKNGITLIQEVALTYRVVGNHGWTFQYPDENQTATLTAGTSDIVFEFSATNNTLNVYQYETTALPSVKTGNKAVKMIENGMIIMRVNGVRYNVLGTQF